MHNTGQHCTSLHSTGHHRTTLSTTGHMTSLDTTGHQWTTQDTVIVEAESSILSPRLPFPSWIVLAVLCVPTCWTIPSKTGHLDKTGNTFSNPRLLMGTRVEALPPISINHYTQSQTCGDTCRGPSFHQYWSLRTDLWGYVQRPFHPSVLIVTHSDRLVGTRVEALPSISINHYTQTCGDKCRGPSFHQHESLHTDLHISDAIT